MKVFDTFVAYKFIKLLTTPFDETDAYKLGIIDAKGNILKKRKDLINSKDKAAYPSNVYTLVWNLQKILNKVPIVKSRIGKFATALYLLKEESGVPLDPMLIEAVTMHYGLNKEDLLSELEGKAILMENRNNNIRLTSHLNLSGAGQLQERYGDSVLSWRDLPDDEREDIALLIFRDREAAKIAKEPWVMISKKIQDKLVKALEKETDGLVTLEESRYGDAELEWDSMPEDEKFDVAEIAFGERKAVKISKTKWARIDPKMKKTLIKTMEDETDGLVTIKEEAKSKDIVKGLTDMDGPFTVVAIKNNKVIKQENTKMKDMLPAIVKMMRKEVGVNVTIGIEDKKGTIRHTFKESVNEEMDPRDHVKKKDGKYCVYDSDGNVAKEFNKIGDAHIWAIDNHDDLMLDESVDLKEVDLRDLATKGMGTLTAKQARQTVGKDQQFFSKNGGKKLEGRVVKVSSSHYTIRDNKTKENHTFKVYDEEKAKELINETASGMPLKAIPATYRFEDKKSSQAFTKAIKVNYSSDTAIATSDGRIAHVEFFTKDKEVRRRISKLAKDMRGKVIGEGSEKRTSWSLDELIGTTSTAIPQNRDGVVGVKKKRKKKLM